MNFFPFFFRKQVRISAMSFIAPEKENSEERRKNQKNILLSDKNYKHFAGEQSRILRISPTERKNVTREQENEGLDLTLGREM